MQAYPPIHWETNAAATVRGIRRIIGTVFSMGRKLYSLGIARLSGKRICPRAHADEQYRYATCNH